MTAGSVMRESIVRPTRERDGRRLASGPRLAKYRSDKTDGPTAGTAALDPLEFLARLLTHIPDPGQVMTRYYGWYASRTRGTRARLARLASDGRRLTADG